ncbi:uncharacterized protein FOKN1_1374 [Thiohalobacter thiocyanaticus]|uniref:Antitoxin Xre/MbcA/ParS-like toxin-binding domain-containing protein n=2 Tax=Thiohalobacter thiocyanaticus TaxID=585455 RepID=A0A1Z4VQT7_9GAMM|nr:uncharacterized protein FOKN1_1374 [Thiohalobacter thiocyanaticus]
MTTTMDVSTLDPQRVATAALQGFFTITGQWGLSGAEQRKLLGDPPEDTFFEWRTEHTASQLEPDTLKRISYILGIHKALCILLPSRRAAFEWVKKPNDAPLFQGQTALSRMLTGRMEDLHDVRAYLDGECGDTMEMEHRNFRAIIVIDFDEQDQCYHGHVTNFPGIWPFHGATIDALRQAFEQVVDDYYEAHPTFAGMITEADHQAKRDRQAAFARWFDENPDREVPHSKLFENCKIEPSATLKAKQDALDEAMRAFDRTCEKFDNALRELAK